MVLMPRFARAYALARWGIDFYTLLMTEAVFRWWSDAQDRHGQCRLVCRHARAAPLGNLRLGFLWMNRTELHEDLSQLPTGLEL